MKAETATLTAPKICCSNSLLPSEVIKTQFIRPDATISVSAAPKLAVTIKKRIDRCSWLADRCNPPT
jgi:hypothetical protein